MSNARLFVYGSLKRGGRHHDELKGAEFLGEVRTAPGYALEPLGQYLALVATPGRKDSVAGELFEIAEELLLALDDFEGDAYFRGQVVLAGEEVGQAGLKPRRYETNLPHLYEKTDGNDGAALAYFMKAR